MKITSKPPTLQPHMTRTAQTRSQSVSRLDSNSAAFQRLLDTKLATVQTPAPAAAARPAPGSPSTSALPPGTTNVFGLVTANATAPAATDAPTTTTPPVDDHPTVESIFGPTPWIMNPGGYSSGLGAYGYNPQYFATKETAEKVAQMLGGTVVQQNAMVGDNGPFFQTTPNYMVQLPNGHLVNAGLTATYFTHGWSWSTINQMLGYDRLV